MVEVRWTPQAADDLEAITEFIGADSPHYASLFVLDVFAAIEQVERFPQSGRIVPERGDPTVREVILGNYRLVYRVQKEAAVLLTIHHGARLIDRSALD